MRNIACCGFGHRDTIRDIDDQLWTLLRDFIEKQGVNIFYVGENGDFDRAFAGAVRRLKQLFPTIKLYLVMPYLTKAMNQEKEYYETAFDDIVIPQSLMGCHYKAAIKKRNCWMVDACDFVVDGTVREFGGAYSGVNYARKKGKRIYKIG